MLESLKFLQAELPWFPYLSAFVFGAIVGSFLNVCIYRIPAGKSLVHPGSTCACGKPIAWHDNIPILSWFILRGKARCCGRPYSFRYPMIELLTGLLFLAAWNAHQDAPLKALCIMLLVSMLVCGSFIDFDIMEIPNRFSVGLAIIGFAISVFIPSLHLSTNQTYAAPPLFSAVESGMGVLIGSGVILWIALIAETILRKEAMGFGDVKLLGGIGAFLGWQGAVFSIFGGALLGLIGVVAWKLAGAIASKNKSKEEESELFGRHIPFGPMLSSGALLYTLLLENQVDAYFRQVTSLFQ
ncbi:prepilin peptidase [Pelagicoccus sp. SDUM812003]|uniref:prepilin peptidase n=1 Tax=Pelagicoccus sp. SDUM812003 TaxID=3041267 RepID=UPI00280CA64C|nr:prepilin peptidase [Pelagicoccus sp. SDUM812003]MDQ8203370.1 prepilin peptidase [Pelagicoccus sp. SDUM812003]